MFTREEIENGTIQSTGMYIHDIAEFKPYKWKHYKIINYYLDA